MMFYFHHFPSEFTGKDFKNEMMHACSPKHFFSLTKKTFIKIFQYALVAELLKFIK